MLYLTETDDHILDDFDVHQLIGLRPVRAEALDRNLRTSAMSRDLTLRVLSILRHRAAAALQDSDSSAYVAYSSALHLLAAALQADVPYVQQCMPTDGFNMDVYWDDCDL